MCRIGKRDRPLDEKNTSSTQLHKEKALSGGWQGDICQGVVMAYFIVMAVVYPFYMPGGYTRIGDVKYEFFRNISLVTLGIMICILVAAALAQRDRKWIVRCYWRMSVTDWSAYGYLVAVMLSYLCSVYREDALWGVDGWYMGAVTQIIFVLLYFFFSRYYYQDLRWVGIWLVTAWAVFVLGICNRYSLYPIAVEGQTEGFLSTLGNINWYCGYWSVTAPVGMALYWCTGSRRVRALAGFYSAAAVLTGVTQGSNSAYLVFIAVYVFLFILSVRPAGQAAESAKDVDADGKGGNAENADRTKTEERETGNSRMYRFLELCMLFAAACQLGRVMRFIPGLTYNYGIYAAEDGSGIAVLLLDGSGTFWAFILLVFLYGMLRIRDKRGPVHLNGHLKGYRALRIILAVGMAVIICGAGFLLLLDSGVIYFREIPGTVEEDGSAALSFNEDWGNGRGAIWNCTIDALKTMDILHKIVGIGPDCYADYIYDIPELGSRMADRFTNLRLTNGHNEGLTMLVNTGMFGWLCYAGIFAAAFVRCLKRAERTPFLYVCAASLLGYTAHNLVSFQQVLNTPYIFIMLGIGENICRHEAGRITDEQ